MPRHRIGRSQAVGLRPGALVVAFAASAALAGCHDPKEASKANFKAALDKFFTHNCLALRIGSPIGFGGFPMTVEVDSGAMSLMGFGLTPEQMSALESAGLLSEKHEARPATSLYTRPTDVVTYNLTKAGAALWRAPDAAGSGTPGGLCDGHIEVVSVDNFTEPTATNGLTVSQVTFTVRRETDAWARNPRLMSAFPDQFGDPVTAQQILPLQLNGDGWAVATGSP